MSVASCRLCTQPLAEDMLIELFGDVDLPHQAVDIIFEHYDVEIRPCDPHSTRICPSCWSITRDFHELYERVQRSEHQLFVVSQQSVDVAPNAEDDPKTDTSCYPNVDEDEDASGTNGSDGNHSDDDYDVGGDDDAGDTDSDSPILSRQPRGRRRRQKHLKCADCARTFTSHLTLRTHQKSHNRTGEEAATTTSAPGDTKPKRRKNHDDGNQQPSSASDEPKKIGCNVCGKVFVNKYVLATHRRVVHENAFAHMCHVCAKTFKSKHVFELHQREHLDTDIPKLQCNICGNWLKHEHSLRKHIARHFQTAETCKLCGKVVPNAHALGNHMRYVHSERIYKCTMCDKAFKKPIGLKEHLASHTGIDLYTCPYCPQTFKSSSNMYAHRKKRHLAQWSLDREQRLK